LQDGAVVQSSAASPATRPGGPPPGKKPSFQAGSRLIQSLFDLFDSVGVFLLLTVRTLAWTFRPPFRLGQLFAQMDFVGVQSVFIVSLTGIFSGMVLALQTVHSLRQFGAEGVVGSIVAISLTREISPVFTALMVTAR